MPTVDAEGLTRIQAQSRIPVTQWKEWCDVLGLDIGEVAEIWDVICFPMMVASRSIPDIAYILQMRATRPDLDLEEFKEELAPVLHTNALLGSLQDESITGGKYRTAVLQLYRYVASSPPASISSRECVRHTIVELCTTALLTKVLPGENVSFTRLARLLSEGRASRKALCSMVAQAEPIAEIVDFLQALSDFDSVVQEHSVDTEVEEESTTSADDDDEEEVEEDSTEDSEFVEEPEPADDVEFGDEDEGDEGDEGEEDEEDDEEDELDLFLDHFRLTLSAIYDPEASGDEDTAESPEARERAIVEFDPLAARIPSVEEARQLATGGGGGNASRARQRGPSRSANPLLGKPSGGRPSTAGSAGPRGGSGGGMKSPSAGSQGSSDERRAKPSAAYIDGTKTDGESSEKESDGLPPLPDSPYDVLQPVQVAPSDLGEIVFHIGQLLGALEGRDERVWTLFHSPEADIEETADLAETLATADSGACDAYRSIRFVAQHQHLKSLLNLPPDKRLKVLRFELEATGFINTVSSSRRVFEVDSRQLIPLPRVLDHAAACLVRLEALRSAVLMIREDPQGFSVAAATERYEDILSNITHLADSTQMGTSREKADQDIATLSAAVAIKRLVEVLVSGSAEYLQTLTDEERLSDVDTLKEATTSTPLLFDGLEPAPDAGALPEECLRTSGLGEIVDAVRDYLFRAVWPFAHPVHESTDVIRQLEQLIRRDLSAFARFEPRRERHHRNPRVALSVIGLDMLTGNPELANLFVRVNVESKLLVIEDFEDGSYVDLFELRENERRQMHARAKERAAAEDSGELQVGSSYLYSLGRTNKPFGASLAEVMGGCVLTEEGEPMVYPIF